MPPTPSWLWGTWSIILGMKPATSVPVVSVMYFPTVPLALARPLGNRLDVEFSSSRADSNALAASTMTRARTCWSDPVVLSTYATPVARPPRSTVTSRAIALPAADAGVELAERALLRGCPAPRRLVRPGQHGRVLGVVPRPAGFEQDHARARQRQRIGGHTAARARADDAHVVAPLLREGLHSEFAPHTAQVRTASRSEVRGSRVGTNSWAK